MSGEMGLILAALERLEARTERIEARTDALEQGVTRLRVDVMDRIDRLQDTLQSVRNDVIVNYANTERVERNVRNGEEQTRLLADQVNLMFKRILGIDERVRTLEEKR